MCAILTARYASALRCLLSSPSSQTISRAISFSLNPGSLWDAPVPSIQQIYHWARPAPYFSVLAPGVRCYVITEDDGHPQDVDRNANLKTLDTDSVVFHHDDVGKETFSDVDEDFEFVDFIRGRYGNQEVLIKRFHQTDTRAIYREADILRVLTPTKIVPEFVGVLPGGPVTWDLPALVLHHVVTSQPLDHFLKHNSPISTLHILGLCRDLANILRALHHRNILQNELHISQLAVDDSTTPTAGSPGPTVQLVDLSEATIGRGICFSVPTVATPLYEHLAPEVLNGERTTNASDIYSLGVVLRAVMSAQRLEKELYLLTGWCCQDDPADRPTVESVCVYTSLLYDLQQKKGAEPLSCADVVELDICNRRLGVCM